MSRIPPPKVKYAQNQLIIVDTRLRRPTRNPTCTSPHNHQAGAPHSLTMPKSATADLRPIVARLPKCRYSKGGDEACWSINAQIRRATYWPPCFAAGASPGTGCPFQPLLKAVSPIAKTPDNPGTAMLPRARLLPRAKLLPGARLHPGVGRHPPTSRLSRHRPGALLAGFLLVASGVALSVATVAPGGRGGPESARNA